MLGRSDPSVAFVTTHEPRVVEADRDRAHHDAAFAERGVALYHWSWHGAAAPWEQVDLVVLRSPWDHLDHLDAFHEFLDRLGPSGTLHNPADLVRWNMDKRYLAELSDRGVPTIPTTFADHEAGLRAALAGVSSAEVVVKPAVSAGARDTGRFATGDPAALALGEHILASGRTAMVQPCARSVAERGELAFVCFDGSVAHTFRKGPLLAEGGGLVDGDYRERITPDEPDGHAAAVAEVALAEVAALARERGWLPADLPPLYARIDTVELDDGSVAVLEAELFEPSFFLDVAPDSAGRFADAVLRRLAGSPALRPG